MNRFDFIDKELAMKNCMNSEEFFMEMLESFVEDSKLIEIKEAYEKNDYKSFGVYAHAIKSQARIIGAVKLSNDSFAMEQAADNEDIDYIKNNYANYIKQYDFILSEISAAL